MRKHINSETVQFEDVMTDNLVLDAAPTLNSFNTVTSDGVARAISGSGNVPAPGADDDGKVLTVVDGAAAWAEGSIPIIDQTYDATSENAQSGTAVAEAVAGVPVLPSSTSADEGKVLTVDSQGDAGWDNPAVNSVETWEDELPDLYYNASEAVPSTDDEYYYGFTISDLDSTPNSVGFEFRHYDGKIGTYYWSVNDYAQQDTQYLSVIAWHPDDASRYCVCLDDHFLEVVTITEDGSTFKAINDESLKTWDLTSANWIDENGDPVDIDPWENWTFSFFDPNNSGNVLPNSKLCIPVQNTVFEYGMFTIKSQAQQLKLVNAINGYGLFANRATYDGDGNEISSTYIRGDDSRLPPDTRHAHVGDVLTVFPDRHSMEWMTPATPSSSSVSVGTTFIDVSYPTYTSAETNPLNLSANTIRCKFSSGFDPSQVDTYFTWTLIDANDNIWDGYNSATEWIYMNDDQYVPLFNEAASYLEEVLGANTSGITAIVCAFTNCSNLTNVELFDVSACTNLHGMFNWCSSLTSLPYLDTSSNTNFDEFAIHAGVTSVPLFDTHNGTSFGWAFAFIPITTVPMFDLSNAIEVGRMFDECPNLEYVPIFDTSAAESTNGMFCGCTALKTVPMLSTASAYNVNEMFAGCTAVEHGALELYEQMSANRNITDDPSKYNTTFYNCGANTATGSAELSQIPSTWKEQP